MKKVTLLFPDEKELFRFAMIMSCGYLQINKSDLTLTCDCEEAEIELAENGFNAKVLQFPTQKEALL